MRLFHRWSARRRRKAAERHARWRTRLERERSASQELERSQLDLANERRRAR